MAHTAIAGIASNLASRSEDPRLGGFPSLVWVVYAVCVPAYRSVLLGKIPLGHKKLAGSKEHLC
ncbi:hypothetical protein L211DRAFT_832632 [Terfezia boudieri ATCC MYA-4762]|uniref:Uncharacterized protein n=1 Tax=Terfezia boudieri ATCC MYA-4762 TaxID=1051890 RepID=A0A3N4M459_9PEZI|nr:hypothetical protein L211DRAFT_832632 [Terfezia boudieri ATCC MYA-4762]